jgi:hypothetical protein
VLGGASIELSLVGKNNLHKCAGMLRDDVFLIGLQR